MTDGTLLTKIVNEQPMYVYFDVDERSLLRLHAAAIGRAATRRPAALRDLEIPCYRAVGRREGFSARRASSTLPRREVNRQHRHRALRGVFENEDRSLVSGLFVRIRIPVSKPYQALLIPERALATDQNIKFVYVVGEDGDGGAPQRRARRPARRPAHRHVGADRGRTGHREGPAARQAGTEGGAEAEPTARRRPSHGDAARRCHAARATHPRRELARKHARALTPWRSSSSTDRSSPRSSP